MGSDDIFHLLFAKIGRANDDDLENMEITEN
jgi:hypothetical protein